MPMKAVNIPKLKFSRAETLSVRALVAIVLLSVICLRAHEYSHIAAVVLQGGTFTTSFAKVYPSPGDNRVVTFIAGPLLTYVVMWTGLVLLLTSHNGKRNGFELIAATVPLFRMVGRVSPHIPGSDELFISRSLHIADPFAAAIVLAILVPPLVFAYFSIDSRFRARWFLFFFVALPMMSLIVVSGLGEFCILGIVKSHTFAGTPLAAMFHGIPVIVLFCDAAVVTSFLFVSRLNRHSNNLLL
jgi:hypothetical protein